MWERRCSDRTGLTCVAAVEVEVWGWTGGGDGRGSISKHLLSVTASLAPLGQSADPAVNFDQPSVLRAGPQRPDKRTDGRTQTSCEWADWEDWSWFPLRQHNRPDYRERGRRGGWRRCSEGNKPLHSSINKNIKYSALILYVHTD